MGSLLTIFKDVIKMPNRPRQKPPQPDTGYALQTTTTLRGVRNKRTTVPQGSLTAAGRGQQ